MDSNAPQELEARQHRAAAWFATLRDSICATFQAIEDQLSPARADGLAPAGSSARPGSARAAVAAR